MSRCFSREWLVLWLSVVLIGWTAPAAAHAPPQVFEAKWQPDGDGLLLVTNRGLIFGDTGFDRWRIMCTLAVGLNTIERPDVAYLPGGKLILASSGGLQATTDDGCTWELVEPFGDLSAPAMAQHPLQPSTLLVATFGVGQSAIQKTTDGGETFSMLRKAEDNDFIEEILFASSAPDSLYESGQVFDAAGSIMHYVALSNDAGLTWQRNQVPLHDDESNFTLLAVDPHDPNVVLAKAEASEPTLQNDRLLISTDGGQSFTSPLSILQISAAAFSADSATLWVAGIEGLWRSRDHGETFEQLPGKSRITSVTDHDGMLWAGGYYAVDTDGLAASTDSGDTFTKLLAFPDVKEQVACDAASKTATECRMPWQDWQREQFGIVDAGTAPPATDAGPVTQRDAGDKDAAPTAASNGAKSGGCGCMTAPVGNATTAARTLLFGLVAWSARWRRRATRRGHPPHTPSL